jgi:uncharacterized repeat protein (TIGR02543 family)
MKKQIVFLVLLACLLALGLSLAACNNGAIDDPEPLTSVVYANTANDGSFYKLTVTQKAARAVSASGSFTPTAGDSYALEIIKEDKVENTSIGTVVGFTGDTFTLKPSNSDTTFSIKVSGEKITNVTGSIAVQGSDIPVTPGSFASSSSGGGGGGGGDGDGSSSGNSQGGNSQGGNSQGGNSQGNTKTYTVTFNANGGTGTVPSMSGTVNEDGNSQGNETVNIILPVGDGLSKIGYAFDGWNTKADGTGTNYQPGDIFSFKANTTLYAKWVVAEHTHIWGEWTETTPATCTTAGVETRYCTLDNSHIEQQEGNPAFGHKWDQWVVTKPATGVADGEKTRICEHNVTHIEREIIPADPNLPGGANNPFHVYDIPTLKKVSTGVDGWTQNAHYIQIADIYLDSIDCWQPTSYSGHSFTGSYDGYYQGNYHTIYNLRIDNTTYSIDQGLFGVIGTGGVVKNLNLVGVNITGGIIVGSVAGVNGGTVTNCSVTGNLTNSSSDGGFGGVVGQNHGTVSNCYFIGNIESVFAGGVVSLNTYGAIVTNSYSMGNIGGSPAGGIVASNGGSITYCYSTASITCNIDNPSSNACGGLSGMCAVGGDFESNTEMSNNVALNPSIIIMIPDVYTGRVVGFDYHSPLSNNYARADMTVTSSSYTSDYGLNKKDGADITAAQWNSASWWQNTVHFDPTVWNLVNGKLPTLKNMPGAVQNPVVN